MDEPKSAFELAMERLRRKDQEAGIVEQALTAKQKADIAEVRNEYQARVAQLEVMHSSAIQRTFDPAAREELEAGYRRDRDRFARERDAKIDKIKKAEE